MKNHVMYHRTLRLGKGKLNNPAVCFAMSVCVSVRPFVTGGKHQNGFLVKFDVEELQ